MRSRDNVLYFNDFTYFSEISHNCLVFFSRVFCIINEQILRIVLLGLII